MTYKPIKTETGWGVVLKDGTLGVDKNSDFAGPWVDTDKWYVSKVAKRNPGSRVVRIRVTYEVGE